MDMSIQLLPDYRSHTKHCLSYRVSLQALVNLALMLVTWNPFRQSQPLFGSDGTMPVAIVDDLIRVPEDPKKRDQKNAEQMDFNFPLLPNNSRALDLKFQPIVSTFYSTFPLPLPMPQPTLWSLTCLVWTLTRARAGKTVSPSTNQWPHWVCPNPQALLNFPDCALFKLLIGLMFVMWSTWSCALHDGCSLQVW